MEDVSGISFSQSVEERTITLCPKIELYGALLNDLEFRLLHSFLASVVDSIRPWRQKPLSTQYGKGIDRRELRRNTPYGLRKSVPHNARKLGGVSYEGPTYCAIAQPVQYDHPCYGQQALSPIGGAGEKSFRKPSMKLETHPQAPFLGRHLALALLSRLADAVLALYEDAYEV
ncbi:hypothetical protein V6N11_034319 [Hibiscus sabdariffa]|uniref:Uncharacterized protein n=1 Tax=Hibiscus sabdariffa TaxID=183260 RepID=A0ABR1ZZC5_9ROSI